MVRDFNLEREGGKQENCELTADNWQLREAPYHAPLI